MLLLVNAQVQFFADVSVFLRQRHFRRFNQPAAAGAAAVAVASKARSNRRTRQHHSCVHVGSAHRTDNRTPRIAATVVSRIRVAVNRLTIK